MRIQHPLGRIASLSFAQTALREQIAQLGNVPYRAERIEDFTRAILEIEILIADLDLALSATGAAIEYARNGGRR